METNKNITPDEFLNLYAPNIKKDLEKYRLRSIVCSLMGRFASSLQPTEPATEKEPDGWVQDGNFITHAEYEELTALHEEPWKPVYFSPVSQTKGLAITDEEIKVMANNYRKKISNFQWSVKVDSYKKGLQDMRSKFQETNQKCKFCGRSEVCQGEYPEGCFLENEILSQSKQETETNKP